MQGRDVLSERVTKAHLRAQGLREGPPPTLPLQVVDLVRVLALLPILLVRLVGQDLDAFSAARLVFAGFGHGVQLSDLILTGERSKIGPPPPPPPGARPEGSQA